MIDLTKKIVMGYQLSQISNSNRVATVVVTLVLNEVEMMLMARCVGDSIERWLKVDCNAVRLGRVQTNLSPL